ncbi:carbon-nitrogen hydrolase family protein [Arsenicibacter rosenii]|uniref:Nitrilase n=1 Tax=Arsenicibacter rosenii TaxID=1750698 RepID=A0A1S2VE50_9BACT|nr:carbon-nitrogen hydrolase family protein [Arsenicibacter rosenii]OIN56700.1 nitrilase [Arsenicibacter rosenii]
MSIKVAVIQATPVFFDREKTLQKLESLVAEQAGQGVRLVVFPESFIPGYPRGFTFGATIGRRTDTGRDLYKTYWQQSMEAGGEDLARLEKIAGRYGVWLVVGITERDPVNGSLYCTSVYVSPSEGLLGKHRKIKPTGVERLVWAEGGADSLKAFMTEIGTLGGLICWENYMPLARMAMYRQGVEIYIAPTADSRPTWTATMQHIACEGRCYVLGCNQFFRVEDYPAAYREGIADSTEDIICRGGSVIVSPQGEILAGPLWDQEGVLVADLDLDEVIKSKLDFDVIGHYTRDDLFQLTITTPS